MTTATRFNIVLGSTSDEAKVLPGIADFTRQHPDLEVRVHYASADNTPEKVHRIVHSLISHGPDVFISGAGLSNVLTNVIKTYFGLEDLNIGIPISDSISGGLTALLSTSEKPPRNPVLTVGVNNSFAALNIAYRFIQGLNNIVIFDEEPEQLAIQTLREKCDELELSYTLRKFPEIAPDDLVLRVFGPNRFDLGYADSKLKFGRGIQVGVSSMPFFQYFQNYLHFLDGTCATGIVSSQGYDNAVQMAAILTRNAVVLDRIKEVKDKKAAELRAHEGLLVKGGEVTRL